MFILRSALSVYLLIPLLLITSLYTHSSSAQTDNAQPTNAKIFTIGYIELKKDDRYKRKRLFARFMGQALGRPYQGAEVAMKEIKFHGSELGITFALEKKTVRKSSELNEAVTAFQQQGVNFILADLPAAELSVLAQATAKQQQSLALFNVSAYENSLREQQCQAHLYHPLPSHAMLADGLVQYLVSKKWLRVLQLVGPLEDDQLLAASFERSAKRYGLKITEKREFILSNDPRERRKNNTALLTGGKQDLIYIADSQGEFARDTPYQTLKPQLIVGSEGLSGAAWHWSWERYGAPQLVKRFEKQHKRPMTNTDWAAWMAIKTIAEAVQSTRSNDFATLTQYLTHTDAKFDAFKGDAASYRAWNRQLRQPILIATHNWVVDRAPIKGFLHKTHNLDTLGFDERDSLCKQGS